MEVGGKSINIGGHENILLGQEENNTDVSENPQAVVCLFVLSVELLPGERNSNPLQYSCLENPIGRGASLTAVLRVTKESDTIQRLDRNNNSSLIH